MLVELVPNATYRIRRYPADRLAIDIGDYYADDRALRKTLGWKHRTGVAAALRRTVAYYQKHGSHYL